MWEESGGIPRVRYEMVCEKLKERILALIPSNPRILTMEKPFDLIGIEGFKCGDLDPSWAQVSWAFNAAKAEYKKEEQSGNQKDDA